MTSARLLDPGEWGQGVGLFLPEDAIFDIPGLFRLRGRVRHPVGNNVVVRLVRRRDLHQFDLARTPRTFGLDPRTRTQVVARVEILVVEEVAIALHESE